MSFLRRDNALGWDITDYGEGDFAHKGLYLITIRNGNVHNPKYTKTYAEKIMMLKEGQVSPNHFHWNKMEDIINRGGGNVVFKLWNADRKTEELEDTDVEIFQDGRRYKVPAGSEVILKLRTIITSSGFNQAQVTQLSEKYQCATTTTPTTDSTSLSDASQRLRKMNRLIDCFALNILRQTIKKG